MMVQFIEILSSKKIVVGQLEKFRQGMKLATLIVIALFSLENLASQDVTLKPVDLEAQHTVRLSRDDLKVVFADNKAFGEYHRDRYNGIAELYHTAQDSSVFVPAYAGFNLEHIFGGDSLVELFEPRTHPMELYQVNHAEVLLYQSATPLSKLESLTKFQLVEPHYIDVTFRFIVHDKAFFKHDYLGIFWASYINAPADKKIYFQGSTSGKDTIGWLSAYSNKHGQKSTHLQEAHTPVYFAPNFNATLASNFSEYEFNDPYYYGLFHNMVLAFMFHAEEEIRFSQSPTGGGNGNPAWDFQLIIPNFEVGKEYSFQARVLYKEFTGRADIQHQYKLWKTSISHRPNK